MATGITARIGVISSVIALAALSAAVTLAPVLNAEEAGGGPVGACCLIDQTCFETDVFTCENLPVNGMYQGDGTTCAEVACAPFPPVGACCLPLGFCDCCQHEASCVQIGGTFLGPNSSCEGVLCDGIGACCLSDGTCVSNELVECQVAGGIWNEFAALCSEVTCAGACCMFDTCEITDEDACDASGGAFKGVGTTCFECSNFGQCCLPSGLCSTETLFDCVAVMGGSFRPGLGCAIAAAPVNEENVISDNIAFFVNVASILGLPSGTPVRVLNIGYSVQVLSTCPSPYSDLRIGAGPIGSEVVTVIPTTDPGCGAPARALSGNVPLDIVLDNGILQVFLTEVTDHLFGPDAIYQTFELQIVVEENCFPQRVLNVDQDQWHPTIQSAIDGANNGDALEIATGIHREQIDLMGKDLVLRGVTGSPENTVIDGQFLGTVVHVNGTGLTELRGLTIRAAGALPEDGAVPGAGAGTSGSGVLVQDAAVFIEDCVIADNVATHGGGVRAFNSTANVNRTVFRNNTAFGEGGGLFATDGSEISVFSSTFDDNGANGGGAVYVAGGTQARLERIVARNNTTNFDGAAIFNDGAETLLLNSLLHGNIGLASDGAAIDNSFGGTMTIAGCTVAHNLGQGAGGLSTLDSNTSISNSIFWRNAPAGPQMLFNGSGTNTVRFSNVEGGAPVPNPGGLDADPLFVSAPHDYRLGFGSPCISAGDNLDPFACVCPLATLIPLCLDLDEGPRVRECRVDLGAYESPFFNDCNGNLIADACDISPVFGFLCTATLDVGSLPGNSAVFTADPNVVTLIGNDDGVGEPTVAYIGTTLNVTGGTFRFDVDYSSTDVGCTPEDDGPQPGRQFAARFAAQPAAQPDGIGGKTGSWDYPILYLNGLVYGLNEDGTVTGPSDLSCGGNGTIDNNNQVAATITVDLTALAGDGPYEAGVGVVSVDNQMGPGVVDISGFFVVDDGNGNGVPDMCDCPQDVDGDDEVAFSDILAVVIAWGPCPVGGGCAPDVNGDGEVDFADVLEVIVNWGACF